MDLLKLLETELKAKEGVRTVETSYEEAVKFLRTHDGSYNMLMSDRCFYRGMPKRQNYLMADTKTFVRKAANTNNFVNLLMSTSDRWAGYPKRNTSFSGSTAIGGAGDYADGGNIYVMFPADDAKVGKANTHDFWGSFPILKNDTLFFSISYVNEFLVEMKKDLSETNAQSMRQDLQTMDKKFLTGKLELYKEDKVMKNQIQDCLLNLGLFKVSNMEELLEAVFDPQNNGLDWKHGADALSFAGHSVREVWVEGKILFVRRDIVNAAFTAGVVNAV